MVETNLGLQKEKKITKKMEVQWCKSRKKMKQISENNYVYWKHGHTSWRTIFNAWSKPLSQNLDISDERHLLLVSLSKTRFHIVSLKLHGNYDLMRVKRINVEIWRYYTRRTKNCMECYHKTFFSSLFQVSM